MQGGRETARPLENAPRPLALPTRQSRSQAASSSSAAVSARSASSVRRSWSPNVVGGHHSIASRARQAGSSFPVESIAARNRSLAICAASNARRSDSPKARRPASPTSAARSSKCARLPSRRSARASRTVSHAKTSAPSAASAVTTPARAELGHPALHAPKAGLTPCSLACAWRDERDALKSRILAQHPHLGRRVARRGYRRGWSVMRRFGYS
jgi:hypothetical protein